MELALDARELRIELSPLEKLLSLHGSLRIPLEQIIAARWGAPRASWRELRMPGTFLPFMIKAGTYYTPRGREFWYVTRGGEPLTIELKEGGKYRRIVLSVADSKSRIQPIIDRLKGNGGD